MPLSLLFWGGLKKRSQVLCQFLCFCRSCLNLDFKSSSKVILSPTHSIFICQLFRPWVIHSGTCYMQSCIHVKRQSQFHTSPLIPVPSACDDGDMKSKLSEPQQRNHSEYKPCTSPACLLLPHLSQSIKSLLFRTALFRISSSKQPAAVTFISCGLFPSI